MRLCSKLKTAAIVILTSFVVVATPVRAGFTLVTSRSALAGNDSLDWGTLGVPTFTPLSSTFTITSTNGVTATVNNADAFYLNWTPGTNVFPPYWEGNFAPNAPLLHDNSPAPISISLPTPVFGGGAQIQANGGSSLTAVITALDASNNVLASFTETGSNNGNADNSALFIGIHSDTANISQFQFNLSGRLDFAINQFDFQTTPAINGVPEPSSLTLFGLGGIGLLGYIRRRRVVAVP